MTITHKLYFSNISTSDHQQDEKIGEVCIANISPKERQLRMRFGMMQLAISLIILIVLIALDLDPLWRLPLIFMFWTAAIGYFQAKDKTWVALASRGLRKFGETEEKIENNAERKQVRRQALKILFKSFLVSAALTLIAYWIP